MVIMIFNCPRKVKDYREQKVKQLNKALNAAASQADKEKVFREYFFSVSNKEIDEFIFNLEGFEKWEASCNQYLLAQSNLANMHGCNHIMEEYWESQVDKMQPGSGLRAQPLNEIMCANCTGNSVTRCEKRGTMVCSEGCRLVKYCSQRCQKEHSPAHKVDCKSRYAQTDWLKGSRYDMTAEPEDASAEPQIVGRSFHSTAIRFTSSTASLPTPCSACLAESGDLSDMVQTILSVPDGYEGEITLHLNHVSLNVAFSNLLSLLAMGTLGELSCDMLIQMWYSVEMTDNQMLDITKMFGKLVRDSEGEVMKGPYSLPKLSHVTLTVDFELKHWFVMMTDYTSQSPRNIGKCMEDRKKHLLSPQGKRYAVEMLTTLSSHLRVSWDKFVELGMLLPLGAFNVYHSVQNPFLFDVDNRWRPESQLDPLQCWPRAEITAAGEKYRVPSNDIYGALFFLIRQKLSECIRKLSMHKFHIIVTCCEPSALVHRLQQSKTAMHYISGVDARQLQYAHSDDQELSALSVRALKEIIQGAGLSSEGCLEKSDLVDRAALILGRAAPSNGKYSAAADATLPPTQQPDKASERIRFIEARASLDPPDILAVCYLAQLGNVSWMEKGAEKSIPECLALYGWHQLCWFTCENALSALSHLKRAKDMKNAEGLLFWGLAMESAYGDTADASSVAWTCYHESACLGNEFGMFNVAHVLSARGDHKQAVGWWKKAMQHGPSLFELYRCYHHGHGCTQDDLKAKKYLQQAAGKGYGPACAALSEWYGSGWKDVFRKNPEKQAHWRKQATMKHRPLIYNYPLRSLLGTNATPAWCKYLRAVVELMEPSNDEGTTSGGRTVSAEMDTKFDMCKFAVEGAAKFIMQTNLTPSNGGGMGDFSSTPQHHSFLLRAESLALTSVERLQLHGIVQEITDVLTRSKVIASVEVCGSYGKGTAVSGCADLDMVAITVKCFESDMYLSLQRHVATLLEDLKVDIKHKPLAVSFTYKHVGIDVVLASPNIEPLSQCCLPPRPRNFRRPSLSVQECAFLRAQPPLFGAVVRLLKNWRASAENWPHHNKPRSYLLELIALAAIQKVNTSQFTEETVRNGFVASLELLLQVISGNLKLYWVDNYPEYSIEFENHDGPTVMDPFDPTNNLAGLLQIQNWHPLSQLAEHTLIAIRDHNLVQRVIHITPTAEQRVSAISPQYRFSCFVLRAEQCVTAGNLEEALVDLAAASQIDSSNLKLQCLWHECITQLFDEECEAKQSSLTEAELLLRLKDAVVDSERVSRFGKKVFAHPVKAPDFISKARYACDEMDIPFSTYMCSCDEADSDDSLEEEDIPRMMKLFPKASEDELYSPQITSVVWKSAFKDGMYSEWLLLRHRTNKMPSKEQRDMYTRASLQNVMAYNALCVGKDVIGLDRLTASILATAQTGLKPELHALALTAAKRVLREASSEMQVLPHCSLSLQVAASIVHVYMYLMMKAWPKAREALKPLLKRDDLYNRADVCYCIGSGLLWLQDCDAAMVWHERGIAADPTFRINFWALGYAMIYSKSTTETDSERKSLIMKTAEKHLWQYIKQGVPEDKCRCAVMYELVIVAMLSLNFREARHRLEMAIEADIRRTQIYDGPCNTRGKQSLLVIGTKMEHLAKVTGAAMQKDDSEINLFFDTVRTKLCGNPLLITVDMANKLKKLSSVYLHTMRDNVSQLMATSFWSGDKSKSEFAADILKNLTLSEDSDDSVAREDDVNEDQGEKQKDMRHIVVDCEGSGEFLSLGEALRSGCIATGTVITMKGGTYKETIDLCIKHEHLTIRAESSKEKVFIKSYAGIRVEANHVTLSGLSVDRLSPKGHNGVEDLYGYAIYVQAGTAVVLENCTAISATGAAIIIGDSAHSSDIEVSMVMCNARSSVGNAFVCAGSRTQVQLQQCKATHSKNGLEVRTGARAHVRSSHFSFNENSGVLIWQHASAETVVGPDNIIQDNEGSGALLSALGVLFHHNKVTGNKFCGVTVHADPAPGFRDVEVKVEDCEVLMNGLGGVQFCGGTCGVISGCHIKENNLCGIMVGMGVEKLSIVGNRIEGNNSLGETGIVMQGRAKVADNNKFSNNRVTRETLEECVLELFKSEEFGKSNEYHQRRHESKQRRRDILESKQMAPHLFGRLQCAKCGAEGGPRKKMVPCVKCNEVVYCSMQCLKADANHHERSCDPVAFYETPDGKEITFDAEHLQRLQAERENAGMVCANCNDIANKEPFKKCAKCKRAAYCSKECQKKHWPVHKTVCKSAPKESCSKKTEPMVSLPSSFVTVKATTQHPLEAKHKSTRDTHLCIYIYISPDGGLVMDPVVGTFQLSNDAVPMVIKIQGSEDDLIKKITHLEFYNENRSVRGWIHAAMNTTGEFKDAYTLICDTIMQHGDAGRVCGKKGYFEAVVHRNMEVKVNCGTLVAENIEW